MFAKIYSWCRNKSVDLELVCSSPPKFKDKSWSNCEADGCDDYNADFKNPMDELIMNEHKLSTRVHENYVNSISSPLPEKQFQDQETEIHFTYMCASTTIFVVLIFLLIALAVLSYRLKLRLSPRKGVVQSNLEDCPLSSTEHEMYGKQHRVTEGLSLA
jgi:hypothetical protein